MSDKVENLGFARIDHERADRCGFPEVVYGPGKTPEQVDQIFARLAVQNRNVLCTRASAEAAALVCARFPEVVHDPGNGLLSMHRDRAVKGVGVVLVVTGGTADQAIAREAFRCAEVMGNEVDLLQDVGVAGLHRLMEEADRLRRARVLVCVAGLESALPSVVAGLVSRPVIAVPTSVGYGVAEGGITALLAAMSSCAAGVTVVNIDNGFGAAYAASLMNRP